jgi:translation initiation factor 3 subunit B
VNQIDFSPSERYLVTSSGAAVGVGAEQESVVVHDVRTGKKLRGFEREKGELGAVWPQLKWSHDDKFIARISVDTVSVYETPSMTLLEKKSIKVPNIKDALWSPSANLLAYWVPEAAGLPASVSVMEFPSREVKREKHLFNVVDIRLHWHPQGDYLCVKVSRKKSKKHIITNFEIVRIRMKEMPIETLEMDADIVAFAWEPQGHRFAVIYHPDGTLRNHVAIYAVKSGKVKLVKTYESRQANALFWSPLGGHLVLAGFGAFNGQLEWIDVDAGESLTPTPAEHFQCSDVEWDPSGRFAITSATQPVGDAHWKVRR